MVLTNRSANAFARGDRTGVLMASMPIEANTASQPVVNLVSRSRIKNRNDRPASSSSAVKLRATWVTQGPVGFSVTPRRWTTRRSTSITKHLVAPEQDGVDMEEVGGHDALGLGVEELGPARPPAVGLAERRGGEAHWRRFSWTR